MRVAGNVAEMEDAVDSHEGWGHPGAEGPWASVMTLILMVGECPPVLEICFFGGSIWFSCVGQSRTEVVCGVTREEKNFRTFGRSSLFSSGYGVVAAVMSSFDLSYGYSRLCKGVKKQLLALHL